MFCHQGGICFPCSSYACPTSRAYAVIACNHCSFLLPLSLHRYLVFHLIKFQSALSLVFGRGHWHDPFMFPFWVSCDFDTYEMCLHWPCLCVSLVSHCRLSLNCHFVPALHLAWVTSQHTLGHALQVWQETDTSRPCFRIPRECAWHTQMDSGCLPVSS